MLELIEKGEGLLGSKIVNETEAFCGMSACDHCGTKEGMRVKHMTSYSTFNLYSE